jgi:hypothetical protein
MSYYKINNLEEYFKHYKISSYPKILGQSGVWKLLGTKNDKVCRLLILKPI